MIPIDIGIVAFMDMMAGIADDFDDRLTTLGVASQRPEWFSSIQLLCGGSEQPRFRMMPAAQQGPVIAAADGWTESMRP